MIDIRNKRSFYRIYRKRKANNKFRIIHAPFGRLKDEQHYLLKSLEQRYKISELVFGFVKGKSVANLANLHINKDWLITIDIKDFFPSIKKDMILKLGLTEYESEIATLDDKLIQGSPCSPIISNIFISPIIDEISKTLKLYNKTIDIGIYADDISISGNKKPSWKIVRYIRDLLFVNGLKINEGKTKFMFKTEEQKVLGITVNKTVSINHKIRKRIRAAIHQNQITESVKGYIAYTGSVNKEQYNRLKSLTY